MAHQSNGKTAAVAAHGHGGGHHAEPDHDDYGHVSSLKVLFAVFGALMALTVITVAVAHVHLGEWNLIVAMVIATIKATLVALFFMHLYYDKGFVRITFVTSLLFLSLFITFALMDSGQYQKTIHWHELLEQPAAGAAPAAEHH